MGAGASVDVNPSIASGVLPGKASASAQELKTAVWSQVSTRSLIRAWLTTRGLRAHDFVHSRQMDDLLARLPQNADGTYNLEAFKQALHSPPAPTAAAGEWLLSATAAREGDAHIESRARKGSRLLGIVQAPPRRSCPRPRRRWSRSSGRCRRRWRTPSRCFSKLRRPSTASPRMTSPRSVPHNKALKAYLS
jgi:hypothetical protein